MSDTTTPPSDETISGPLIEEMAAVWQREADNRFGEFTSSGQWMRATALAVNGGAAVALLSAVDKIGFDASLFKWFIVGVASTLVAGVLQWIYSSNRYERARDVAFNFRAIKRGAATLEDVHEELLKRAPSPVAKPTPVLLTAFAIACFMVGSVTVSRTLRRDFAPLVARCSALQHDMLSAHPRKKDGASLFMAMGCRSRGEDSVMVPASRAEYLKAQPLGRVTTNNR
jgi:hypothetical protein